MLPAPSKVWLCLDRFIRRDISAFCVVSHAEMGMDFILLIIVGKTLHVIDTPAPVAKNVDAGTPDGLLKPADRYERGSVYFHV